MTFWMIQYAVRPLRRDTHFHIERISTEKVSRYSTGRISRRTGIDGGGGGLRAPVIQLNSHYVDQLASVVGVNPSVETVFDGHAWGNFQTARPRVFDSAARIYSNA
jgi:hypothetical protein